MYVPEDKMQILLEHYSTGVSKEIFNYLKRRVKVSFIVNDFTGSKFPCISFDEKKLIVRQNKKDLKYRLIRYIDEDFHHIDISVVHRTIKMFLDMVLIMRED